MASNEVHNPDVYVEAVRKIAARGLVPGHEGSWVDLGQGTRGILNRFYHRTDGYTEFEVDTMSQAGVVRIVLKHLNEIQIRA